MTNRFLLLAAFLWCVALPAYAQAPAEVLALQSPAWLERAGTRMPLRAGEQLAASDVIETGDNGRVHLRLADDSIVKLGSGARFTLDRLAIPAQPDGVFSGALSVLRGAFRFTTDAAARFRYQRNLTVKIATVTVGVRGTDLWGRSNDESDLVCLIEGRISVDHPRAGAITMDQPLTFFKAPRNANPEPVSAVDPDQLQRWAQETEMAPDHGAMAATGGWRVKMLETANRDAARALQERMRTEGYPARLSEKRVNQEQRYIVSLDGFSSEHEAQGLADRIRSLFSAAPSH